MATNEQLLKEVKDQACSCDVMLGWTCSFCRETLPKLRKALKTETLVYRKRKSLYEPRKMPKTVLVER